MPKVLNLNFPLWGSLLTEYIVDDAHNVRDEFLTELAEDENSAEYLTFDEYVDVLRQSVSVVSFFSNGGFSFRTFSRIVKHIDLTDDVDKVLQRFIYAVHTDSLLSKSDKVTKLTRELKPLRAALSDEGLNDINVGIAIMAFMLRYPELPTRETVRIMQDVFHGMTDENLEEYAQQSIRTIEQKAFHE